MNSDSDLVDAFITIVEKRGRKALERAQREILSLEYGGIISSAVKYFAEVTLSRGLPVFPTLVSLCCEGTGGSQKDSTAVGSAMLLISAAADIHDDVIDRSSVKYSRKTVYGKFGSDVALLAGDTLLFQGSVLLHKECSALGERQKTIPILIPPALFEISNAEAMETRLFNEKHVNPQQYFEILRSKAVISEVLCKIGGILGNATPEDVEALGQYGRTYGILSLIKEEFTDLEDIQEFQNRTINGCLPLPVLIALKDPKTKSALKSLLKDQMLTKEKAKKIRENVFNSEGVHNLKIDLDSMVKRETAKIATILKRTETQDATLLLQACSLRY